MTQSVVNLGGRAVGEGEPVFIICEGGVTNYGELGLAKKQVDASVVARADIIKFQVWSTENLVSRKTAKKLEGELGYNWFSRLQEKEMSFEKVYKLADYVKSQGMPFFATAHENIGLDFLDQKMNQPFFKIGSGEAHNYEFLKSVGSRGKPVIISFGLQSDEEIIKAIDVLRSVGADGIVALHCVTAYPTPYDKINLNRMLHLKKILSVPVGISDHSVGWHVPLAAVALGANVVEKHLTFDKKDPRSLDNPGALLPEEFAIMVRQIRDLELALKSVAETDRKKFSERERTWAGQSMVASQDIMPGTAITGSLVAFKRPAKGGLPPEYFQKIIGKKAKKLIAEDEQITMDLLEN